MLDPQLHQTEEGFNEHEESKDDNRESARRRQLPEGSSPQIDDRTRQRSHRSTSHQREDDLEERKEEAVIDIREPAQRQQFPEGRPPQTDIPGRAGQKSQRYTAEDFMHEVFPASEKIKLGIAGLVSIALIISIGPIGMLLGLIGIAYCAFKYSDAKKEAALKAKDENINIEKNEKAAKHGQEKDAFTAQMQMYQQQFEQTSRLLEAITQRLQMHPYPYMSGTAYAQQSFGAPQYHPHVVVSPIAREQMSNSSLNSSARSSSISQNRSRDSAEIQHYS